MRPFITPPLNRTALAGRCAPRNADKVARDSGVGGERQAQLAQTHAPLALGLLAQIGAGKEAVDQHRLHVAAQERGLDRSADDLGAAAEHHHRRLGGVAAAEQQFFCAAAGVHQRRELPVVELGRLQPRADRVRQRQIHVVAAEQDVIADRDPLERQVAASASPTEMSEKSVVPPPTSQTSTTSPTVSSLRQPAPLWPSQE